MSSKFQTKNIRLLKTRGMQVKSNIVRKIENNGEHGQIDRQTDVYQGW